MKFSIALDIYSHVLPGIQEEAAEKFDRIFAVDENENFDANVSKYIPNLTCKALLKDNGSYLSVYPRGISLNEVTR